MRAAKLLESEVYKRVLILLEVCIIRKAEVDARAGTWVPAQKKPGSPLKKNLKKKKRGDAPLRAQGATLLTVFDIVL